MKKFLVLSIIISVCLFGLVACDDASPTSGYYVPDTTEVLESRDGLSYPELAFADSTYEEADEETYSPSEQEIEYNDTGENEDNGEAIDEGTYQSEESVAYEPIPTAEPEPEPTLPFGLTEAIVSRVIDGDTIELSTGERVRFIGIDTPEVGEAGADEATAFVRERIEGQAIWLEADGNDTDVHGRLRRYIWLQIPTDTQDESQIRAYMLNALLLENELASVMIIGNVRNEALFRSLVPEPPPPPPPVQEEPPPVVQTTRNFIGNRNSQIFHRTTCGTLPAAQNRIYFATREDAIAAGHRACQRCRP